MFALITTYDLDHNEYYVITCHRRNFIIKIINIQVKFPNMRVLLELIYIPDYVIKYNKYN